MPSSDELQTCRQVLAAILSQSDLLLFQNPERYIAVMRSHYHLLSVCRNQPEFARWLHRLRAFLDAFSSHQRTNEDDTIDLVALSSSDLSSATLGVWAAALYLDETVAVCPAPIVADFTIWLRSLSSIITCRIQQQVGGAAFTALHAFTSICVAAADASRLDALLPHVFPVLSQLTSAAPSRDRSAALAVLDTLLRLATSLNRAIRPQATRMLAYALRCSDHDDDDVRTAAALAYATVAGSCCSAAVPLSDFVHGLDRILDRYLCRSLTNDAPSNVADQDVPFQTPPPLGAFPVDAVLRRWRFLCETIRAVLNDDAASVAVCIEDVLRSLERAVRTIVPVNLLTTITSHPISCLDLAASLPSVHSDALLTLSSLCRRLGRRLLPFSTVITAMLAALPLERTIIALPAAVEAIGSGLLEPILIPAIGAVCQRMRQATAACEPVVVVDFAIKRGKKRAAATTTPATPAVAPSLGPYIGLLECILRHVGDRLSLDVLRDIAGVVNVALTAPSLIRDRSRLLHCLRELVSARYRAGGPDLGLVRQAGRLFAAGQFGRDCGACLQGLALLNHLASPAVPVALHHRVLQQESILRIELGAGRASTVPGTNPQTTMPTRAPSLSPVEDIQSSSVIPQHLMMDGGRTAPSDLGLVPASLHHNSAGIKGTDVPLPNCQPTRTQSPIFSDGCDYAPTFADAAEQKPMRTKRKEPEPVDVSVDPGAALLVDIGPDDADDQTPLWCF